MLRMLERPPAAASDKNWNNFADQRPLDLSPQFLSRPITSYWDNQIDISAVITCSSGNVYMTHFEIRESGYKFSMPDQTCLKRSRR